MATTPAPAQPTPDPLAVAPPRPAAEQSLGELVATASRQASILINQQVALAKAELQQSAKQAGTGVGMFGGAGVLAAYAFGILLVAAAYGIHGLGLALGWSYLIVGGVLLIIVAILALLGRRHLERVKGPERAIASAQASAQAVADSAKAGLDRGLGRDKTWSDAVAVPSRPPAAPAPPAPPAPPA